MNVKGLNDLMRVEIYMWENKRKVNSRGNLNSIMYLIQNICYGNFWPFESTKNPFSHVSLRTFWPLNKGRSISLMPGKCCNTNKTHSHTYEKDLELAQNEMPETYIILNLNIEAINGAIDEFIKGINTGVIQWEESGSTIFGKPLSFTCSGIVAACLNAGGMYNIVPIEKTEDATRIKWSEFFYFITLSSVGYGLWTIFQMSKHDERIPKYYQLHPLITSIDAFAILQQKLLWLAQGILNMTDPNNIDDLNWTKKDLKKSREDISGPPKICYPAFWFIAQCIKDIACNVNEQSQRVNESIKTSKKEIFTVTLPTKKELFLGTANIVTFTAIGYLSFSWVTNKALLNTLTPKDIRNIAKKAQDKQNNIQNSVKRKKTTFLNSILDFTTFPVVPFISLAVLSLFGSKKHQ